MSLLVTFLRRFVREGHPTLIDAGGRVHKIGVVEQPPIVIRLHDKATERAMMPERELAVVKRQNLRA